MIFSFFSFDIFFKYMETFWNKTDLQALTLVGPSQEDLVLGLDWVGGQVIHLAF